jgi:predicted TIM-barrel fold metal-dependent hydrolase
MAQQDTDLTTRSRAGRALPAGATDCHSHVVGSPEWPMVEGRKYEPESGSAQSYAGVLTRLGIDRCVLVQPSFYGTDNGCQIAAMKVIGVERCRGIAVVDEDVAADEIQRLHMLGMRGVRFNLMSGGLKLRSLEKIANKIAAFGWHVQVFASCRVLADIATRLSALPVPVAIDHMGCPEKGGGVSQPGFQAVLRLLEDGVAWVKLAGAERLSAQSTGFEDVVPYARALLAAAPDRVVWGLDWPPSRYFAAPPAPEDWISLLFNYTDDQRLLRTILVDNPSRLYDFLDASASMA